MIGHRFALPLFIFLLSISLGCVSVVFLRKKETRSLEANVKMLSHHRFEAVAAVYSESLSVLESLKSFYRASHQVSRDEFGTISQEFIKKNSFIRALAWAPLVTQPERHTFEQNARRQGMEDYQFSIFNNDGLICRSPLKASYFPIYHIEPHSGNESMIGFDLASNLQWADVLREAWGSGRSIATPPIKQFQTSLFPKEFILVTPVYKRNAITFIPAGREDGLAGFLIGVIKVSGLIDDAVANATDRGTGLYLFDTTRGESTAVLLDVFQPHDQSPYPKSDEDVNVGAFISSLGANQYFEKTEFSFAGRKWTMVSVANDEMIDEHITKQPGIVALITIFIGGLIALLFRSQVNQKLLVEEKVDIRTEALQHAVKKIQSTEKTLRESEEKARSILNASPAAIVLLNPAGHVLDCNDVFLERLGIEREKMAGMCLWEIPTGEKMRLPRKQIAHTFKTGGMSLVEDEQNGIWIEYRIIAATKTDKGDVGTVVVEALDITVRKTAEIALRESEEKLERSKKMESLGVLAGGVAHDLNNILSGIVSYPELLLLNLPEDSKLRKPIEIIQKSGRSAAAIVQDMITMARGVAVAKEPLNLNPIIEDYVQSPEHKKLAQAHIAVTAKTRLAADLLNISGSEAHLKKVIMNLVANAVEAIEGSGRVTISTENRYVENLIRGYEDVPPGEYVVLAVSDEGPGISSADIERIFEPFYSKKVMGRSGTGLGLAIVWNVVRDLKGYFNITADKRGTTFELYFPVTRAKTPNKTSLLSITDYQGKGETVLVVDDVESQRHIACEMLRILGYEAIAVSSGEAAVEYLTTHSVDLVLLDMIMEPGINGPETYERIRAICPGQKAIIASGYADTDKVRSVQEMGAGTLLSKPMTLEKMGIALRDELSTAG